VRLVDGARVAAAVAARPGLWGTAVRQCRRTAPPGWWRRAPFLPVPSGDYLRFRLVTQYGDENAPIAPPDVIDYLSWCKQQDRLGRTAG
jgi:hypothetical protein